MMKHKPITVFFSIILTLALLCSQSVFALPDATPYNWFFKKMNGSLPPPDAPELSFINDYSVRWIDKEASDSDKVIYLTFDAGYSNESLSSILDTLKEKNVTGTFFILENLINRAPDVVTRMHTEGHEIGNHTAKHCDVTRICDKNIFLSQLTDLEKCCEEKLGFAPSKYFRPPEGRISERSLSFLESAGYKTVFWSFAYADWDNDRQPSPDLAKKKILDHTHNGMVLLLHPTSKTNAEILPSLIDAWRGMGYRFGTMDELFGVK